MKKMPTRDTSGKCTGECRDRIHEGELERQTTINLHDEVEYSSPSEKSPEWVFNRNEPPGAMGGRI